MRVHYQQVVDSTTAGGLGEGLPYSILAMAATIQRASANAGVLGMYCNMLMLHKAITGHLPEYPPAELEDVIDGSVKTGVDLSGVRQWCYDESQRILEGYRPIPAILAPRVLGTHSANSLTLTADHWLDHLASVVTDHIRAFEQERDALIQQAMPPAVVFDHAFNEPDRGFIEMGAGLHHAYHNALRLPLQQRGMGNLSAEDYDRAREAAEAYLRQFPPEQHTAILRGAIVSAYLREKPSDAVLWLSGAKTPQGRTVDIAHLTIRALREIGVLEELGETSAGVLVYPGAVVSETTYRRSIGITGVWFNWYRAWQQAHGYTPATATHKVSQASARWAKQQVADISHTIL